MPDVKHAFDGLRSRLCVAEGRISESEDMTAETFKTEKQRQKDEPKHKKPGKKKAETEHPRTVGQPQKVLPIRGDARRRKQREGEVMTKKSP